MSRQISEIAKEIVVAWPKPSYAAIPYLDAMLQIHGGPETMYYAESGRSIVSYFLCNAGAFRGDEAKRLKAELKVMVTL